MKTFKILGLFLSYPEPVMIGHLGDLLDIIRDEKLLPGRFVKRITAFATELGSGDIYDLQENYVELFDRGRAHCLQLFEHIHGESRDRGQAMVDLAETYAAKGLYVSSGDLPDYLPLFLEYLSLCPLNEAVELLGQPINVIAAIGVKLKRRGASYGVIFEALEALSRVKADRDMMARAQSEPLENMTHDDIDADWEDSRVFDKDDPESSACNDCNAFPFATEELGNITRDTINGGGENG